MTAFITTMAYRAGLLPYLLCWRDATSTWQVLGRSEELERLIQWAKRKRFSGPERHYRRLLEDTEQVLLRYQLRRPKLVYALRSLNWLLKAIAGTERRYRKGSAAKYRLRRDSLILRGAM
jgi:hypothetical protein